MKKEFKPIEEGLKKVSDYHLSSEKNKEMLKVFENARVEEEFYAMSSKRTFFSKLASHIKQLASAMAAIMIVAIGVVSFNLSPDHESHLNSADDALAKLEALALSEIAYAQGGTFDQDSIQSLLGEINAEIQGAIDSAQSIRNAEKLKVALEDMQDLQAKNILLLNQIGPNIDKGIFDQALEESSENLGKISSALEQLEKAKSVEEVRKSLAQPAKPVSVISTPAPEPILEEELGVDLGGETILDQEPTFNSFNQTNQGSNELANINPTPTIPDEIKQFHYHELTQSNSKDSIVSINFAGAEVETEPSNEEVSPSANAVDENITKEISPNFNVATPTTENTNPTPTIPEEILRNPSLLE